MIKVIKLVSGELVIAEVEESGHGKVKLTNPNVIVFSNQGLMLVPLVPPRDNKDMIVTIDKNNIMFTVDGSNIDQNLYGSYSQRFGSGLTLASTIPPEPTKKM